MTAFRNLPIRRKMTVAVLGTTFVVLLAACAAFLAYERAASRRLKVTYLTALVDALAINCTAALSFNDPGDATETLHALSVRPPVEAATLYRADGAVFATYARDQEGRAVPPRPEPDGARFTHDHLVVVRPVLHNGQRLGTLYVRADLSDLNARLRAFAQISGLVLLGSLLLASALSSVLQRAITRPIFALTDTVKNIAETRDYMVRAEKLSTDEIGTLTDGFNQMLATIQERDTALQTGNEALRAENAERKHAEEELRDREKLLRAVTDSSEDMIFIKDRDSRLLFMNPAGCRLIGRTAEQVIGRTDEELYLGTAQAASFVEMDRRVMEAREARVFEEEFRTADGTLHTLLTAKTPRFDDQGGVIGIIGISRDITERKRAEEEIRQLNASLEQRVRDRTRELQVANASLTDFKAALDQHALVSITDARGKITYANDKFCSISRYSREELLGQDHRIINSGYHPKAFIRELWETITSGRVWLGEIKNRAQDGSFYWVNTTIVPFLGEGGKPAQYIAIRTDITERKQTEERIELLNTDLQRQATQLQTAVKELDAFSYSVSHDLRAPLRAVDGFSRMLVEDCGAQLGDEGRRMLDVIRAETQRMGRLIDDLLAFSRLGRQPIESARIDMHALAQGVFDELAAFEPGRTLRLDLQPLPPASGAEAMLRQVWVNLIGNAIKFTKGREVGEIGIGARADGEGGPVYYVKDNGAGFDMRHADKLFGVFQRLHTQQEFSGTGVGLALVQRIVQRHGGRAWAEAEVGRGATFYFTLAKPAP